MSLTWSKTLKTGSLVMRFNNVSVSEDDLDSLSTRLKMDFNPYVEQTVEALTTMKDAQDMFQYQMKRQRDNLEFIWKKHVPAEDITVRSFYRTTVKFLIFGHPKKCCNNPKIETMWLCHKVMSPKDADGMANRVDPDQTAPEQSDQGLHCLPRSISICPKT